MKMGLSAGLLRLKNILSGSTLEADGTLLDDTLITGVDGYIDYGPLVPGESYVVTEIEVCADAFKIYKIL